MDSHHSDVHEHTDADNIIGKLINPLCCWRATNITILHLYAHAGRDKELSLFMEELRHVSEHTHRNPGVIVISGSEGLGKTKLLRAMKARAAEMGFRVVSGVGGLVEQNTPFFTVKTLITRLLELDSCKNIHDREQLILEHITDETARHLLPLLNDILVLKVNLCMQIRAGRLTTCIYVAGRFYCRFLYGPECWEFKSQLCRSFFFFASKCAQFPQTSTTLHMHHDERTKVLHKLLYSIVHEVGP